MNPIVVTLDHRDYTELDNAARAHYGAALHPDALSYEHARALMAAFLHRFACASNLCITSSQSGSVVASAVLDGEHAARGVVENLARSLAPRIDDAEPLHLCIRPTLRQRLTRRAPQVLQWQPSR